MFKSTTLSEFIPTKRATLASSVLSACFVYSSTVQAQSNLENPVALKVESGISVISGWHCDADEIEVFIDGQSIEHNAQIPKSAAVIKTVGFPFSLTMAH